MTEALPSPLVPAEVDLRDFQYMELDVRRLRDSRFGAEVSGDAFRAGVMLWCACWHQVPCGSVPDDDVELANLAGYGRFVKEWKKVRSQALQGFVLCSDGRLYHEVVGEKARAAWDSRLLHFYERAKDRLRKANKARAAEKPPVDALPELTFEQWNEQRKAAGIPKERAEAFHGIPQKAAEHYSGIPAENPLRGNGEGEGERTERESSGSLALTAGGREPPPDPAATATAYGAISRRLREAGVPDAHPGQQRFRALVDAGATAEEFLAYVPKALDGSIDKPFAYVMGAVEGERKRALTTANGIHRGPLPNRQEALEARNRAVGDRWLEEQEAADAKH